MTEKEKNNLANQYLPLIKKISRQQQSNCSLDYEEVEGFAWEGFMDAVNNYDETRSSMTFQQYLGWRVKHAILNGINKTGRTIKISYYMKRKMSAEGLEVPTTISVEKNFENEDHLCQLGFDDEPSFDNPWDMLIAFVKNNFPAEWTEMFFDEYGLDGHEVIKCKDIAKKQGVSGCLITKRTKKIVQSIYENAELREILRELL